MLTLHEAPPGRASAVSPPRQAGTHPASRAALALALPVLVVVLAAVGCGSRLGSPPLEISYRGSLVGAGVVMKLRNTSRTELRDIRVAATAPDGERRIRVVATLAPGHAVELGWKKLGGWPLRPGYALRITARGFLLPLRAEVPPIG